MIAWARWVWGSMPPGTTILPAASMTRAPSRGSEPGSPTAAMRSPVIPISHAPAPCGVTTCPFAMTMSSMTGSLTERGRRVNEC